MSEADNVEAAPATEATEAPATDRPEWLPEKFKTPEDLVSSYSSLESKLGQNEEQLRQSIIEQFEQEVLQNRPETVGDYQVPESLDSEMAVDNPLFQWWANHSFENGYNQEEFEAGIQQYIEFYNSMQPDLEAEKQQLGDNAEARIEAVDLWAFKFFPDELSDAVLQLGSTDKGIEALEYIKQQMGDTSVNGDSQPASQINEAQLRDMMKDPRYWNPTQREQAFVKQVEEGFSKLYR